MSLGKRPLLFACSGCSNAGRLAYDVARELDRRGDVEMSCLAGVGAEKPLFLKKFEDREVWLIDGCPIHCAKGVLDRVGKRCDVHIRLQDFGVKKNGPLPTETALTDLVDSILRWVDQQGRRG